MNSQVGGIAAPNNQPLHVGGVATMPNTSAATDENEEAYKRKIEALRAYLPRLEKMYANTAGTYV